MTYYQVVIENKSRVIDQIYTYKGSPGLATGTAVYVPFGIHNKERLGIIIGQIEAENLTFSPDKVKEIGEIVKYASLNGEMVQTAIWMRQRYGIKYADCFKCFLPKGKPSNRSAKKVELKISNEHQDTTPHHLTEEQSKALNQIVTAMDAGKQETFLIHGVTGSGKTEVYIKSVEHALECNKTALVLVPEIALTKQLTDRFAARFGEETIAILHSKLTARQRFEQWTRIRNGQAKLVIGARMAVFAPLENIGLIIMDEEHETTYKSDQTPKYETIDIAYKRLMYYQGILVLGSATPSVVSYERAQSGLYKLIEMKTRYHGGPMPEMEIVDMGKELLSGNTSAISQRLYEAMKETLELGQQVILFLNRRGYASNICCPVCGYVDKCSDCQITTTYHKKKNSAVCHYCGRSYRVPQECPNCQSNLIQYQGVGTEQLEELVCQLLPQVEVDRLDLDTATSRNINKILNNFQKGNTKILIGTQLVAKGLDFKNVGLVGIVGADNSLFLPDYRASERTFQLITQVAGRAGRGQHRGLVIIQSNVPDNETIINAMNMDYDNFFQQELKMRQLMGYPPYSDLIVLDIKGADEGVVRQLADQCYYQLNKGLIGQSGCLVFKPKKIEVMVEQGKVKYSILIKAVRGYRNSYVHNLHRFIQEMAPKLKEKDKVSFTIDVNPYSMV